MLTIEEAQYFKSLIDTYKSKGYKYYLLHTKNDYNDYRDDGFDFIIYFSKDNIFANSASNFTVYEGIKLGIDTNLRSDNYNNDSIFSIENFEGTVSINHAEHVYTNAKLLYYDNETLINPDLNLGESINYNYVIQNTSFLFIIICGLLIAYLVRLFRKQ